MWRNATVRLESALMVTDPKAFNWPSDVELVHGVYNDSRGCEKEEQEEERDVEQDAAEPPARTAH